MSIDSTPSIGNGVVYFSDGSATHVYAVDATTGRLLWNSGSAISGAVNGAPSIVGGQLLVSSRDGELHAFGL